MGGGVVIAVAALYAALLFALAAWAERRGGRNPVPRSLSYPFALTVYCTSWTFFGAVGMAYQDGLSFLPIYLGPILLYAFGARFLSRLVAATRAEGATTISDFIGARHARSRAVAALVTLIALLGIVPYLALQLRSIGTSYVRLAGGGDPVAITALSALLLALFAMLFGTRRFDVASRSEGLLFAVSVEGVTKLVTFLAAGLFAALLIGTLPVARQAAGWSLLAERFAPRHIDAEFLIVALISVCAILCLPRQFYIGVIEANSPDDPLRARRTFIAYLALIAVTVVPVTLAALALHPNGTAHPDLVILDMPLGAGAHGIALLVFIGGLSASTAMVAVETLAMATMVSNDLFAPLLLRSTRWRERRDIGRAMLDVRRCTILGLMAVAFGFALLVPPGAQLASMGLIAFAAMAQITPALILSVRRGGRDPAATLAGIGAGGLVWAYTLLVPAVAPPAWLAPLRGTALDPHALLGIEGLRPVGHGVLWSLGANLAVMALVRARRLQRPRISIAFGPGADLPAIHDRDALIALVGRFVGEARARDALSGGTAAIDRAAARTAERLIAGVVGAPSAHALIASALSGSSLTVEDVTRMLDRTGQSLQFSRDLLAATLENIEPGVSVIDRDLTLIAWNSRYLDLFDYPPGMIRVGTPVADLIRHNALRGECGPGEVDAHVERRLVHMRRGQRHSFERVRPDGRVLKTVGGPMPGGGYVMCFTDVTAEAEARAALEASRAQLEQRVAGRTADLSAANAALARATADKTRFLAAASHDLLQPLHAARLFSAALDRKLGEGERPLLGRIDRSIDAAEQLLRTLLDISKLDAGGITPAPERFALRPLLAELADSFAPLAAEKGLRLRLGPGDAVVKTDRVLLRSIVQNFLANAVRYTHRGGILLGLRRAGRDVRIAVYDSGPGIPEADQARIFAEFERIAPRDEAGVGLGLAIVERTARLLGLPIAVASRPGHGSGFSITLPRVAERRVATTVSGERSVADGDRPLRLLVADDDAAVCAAMGSFLAGLGDEVVVAREAAGALAAPGPFDAALLDLDLGTGMDGLALATTLRERMPGLPVAIVTASHGRDTAARAEAAGVTLFGKPADPARLTGWLVAVRRDQPAAARRRSASKVGGSTTAAPSRRKSTGSVNSMPIRSPDDQRDTAATT
jgi:signal transduction histidine kinase/Na+/proline symporter/CheY-like chemotaxis protein